MTPLEMIINDGKVSVHTQNGGKYAYIRIFINKLNRHESFMLLEAFPDSYRCKNRTWKWHSGSLAGLEQIIRTFRKSGLFQEPFIECMMIYLWCHVSKRSHFAKLIDKMLGHRAIMIQEVLKCTQKTCL